MQHHQFNSFWHGNELSPVEWVCLSSFIEHGHKVRLFCYDQIKVPHGVSLADASEIITRDELFLFDGSVSAFSNLFRYELMAKFGDWWIDTDVYCLKDVIPECRYAWAHQDVDLVNGAILKFQPNDPVLHAISSAARQIGRNITFCGELGPHLLTKYLPASQFDDHFGRREEFYPIHWLETFLFWLPGYNGIIQEKCKHSCFLHLWTSVFLEIGVDRFTKPPSESFLEKIYGPHIEEFHLEELSLQKYNRTIESIEAYCHYEWVVSCSARLFGYDISKFPFDKFIDFTTRERQLKVADQTGAPPQSSLAAKIHKARNIMRIAATIAARRLSSPRAAPGKLSTLAAAAIIARSHQIRSVP